MSDSSRPMSRIQPETTPTGKEGAGSSDSCTNHEHDGHTDGAFAPPAGHHQRYDSTHLWWLHASHHRRLNVSHDLMQHLGGTDTSNDSTITPRGVGELKNTRPRLLPSPHIIRADAVDHENNTAGPQRVNRKVSGWSSSQSGVLMEDGLSQKETIPSLESPCQRLAKQMVTPPPHPVPVPRRPFSSRLIKFLSIARYSKGENPNC